ncbi:MAG: sulfotransferase domain-containing protein [Pseudomonadota bacterium]
MTTARATNLKELGELFNRQDRKWVREQGLRLELRPTDVVITPYGKSGTTWTQQIVHTLRTRGDMEFDDISRVVPWIEVSAGLDIDLDAEQRANPRAFKSHLAWDDMPRGGKYINVVRDPANAAVSAFRFMEGWYVEPGAIEINAYLQATFLKTRGYYAHLKSWWPRRNDADVLFLAYEHMLADPEPTIARIAAFIDVALDDELLSLTLEHSSREFMLRHRDRFDDAMLRKQSEELIGLPPGSDSAKVTGGSSKELLSAATLTMFDEVWDAEIATELGLPSYSNLLAAL